MIPVVVLCPRCRSGVLREETGEMVCCDCGHRFPKQEEGRA